MDLHGGFTTFLNLRTLPFGLTVGRNLSLCTYIVHGFIVLFVFFTLVSIPLTGTLFAGKLGVAGRRLGRRCGGRRNGPRIGTHIQHLRQRLTVKRVHGIIPGTGIIVAGPARCTITLRCSSSHTTTPFIITGNASRVTLCVHRITTRGRIRIIRFPQLTHSICCAARIGRRVPFRLCQTVTRILACILRVGR